ncbi:hypothetical protein GLOIN_2v1790588 [Rhizophagus irregularis DAOM 181602=DAOM 197198]|nr:hypothetical protein GLOIN_2v1790588 [Rhizophagus irregularis DAOM 181602=DAOM 197198]
MRLGLQDRNRRLQADYSDVTQPPLGKQEPVVLTSKSSGVTQEQLQELLKAQAEELTKNFQVQFKQLQARPDPQDPDWDDGYVDHDVGDDPDAPEWTLDDHQNAIDLIMGYKRGTSKILTKQLQKAKDRRDDLDLARAMRNLDLNDDAMTLILRVLVKSRPQIRQHKSTPAKAVTKNDLLSLLRSADFRKLLREILQEELLSARKVTEIPEDLVEEEQEEDIRCLADTCANASFIQREAAEELGDKK